MRLLGRDAELEDIDRRLQAGRLVTLIGPGGVGKTAPPPKRSTGLRADSPSAPERSTSPESTMPMPVPGALAAQLGFESFQGCSTRPAIDRRCSSSTNCEHLLAAAA